MRSKKACFSMREKGSLLHNLGGFFLTLFLGVESRLDFDRFACLNKQFGFFLGEEKKLYTAKGVQEKQYVLWLL